MCVCVCVCRSERVGRTGVEGIQLAEAKYINLSLHYLEQVIVALSDKSRSHIPYRNSMMTSVLRDRWASACVCVSLSLSLTDCLTHSLGATA